MIYVYFYIHVQRLYTSIALIYGMLISMNHGFTHGLALSIHRSLTSQIVHQFSSVHFTFSSANSPPVITSFYFKDF